ncbi:MAG TPA: sugar phosphate isomerase/epimerase [Ktedonobacteraceae bacterium]|nr:sugar phosphate isomerase/epimerase [Ktedonobacteraceae bacterium]
MNNPQIALELYTVRDETKSDFAGTLRRVAQIGYPGVEFAGYGDLTAREMLALLAETRLYPVATHLGLDALQDSHLDASIGYCLDISCPIIVLPWLANEWRTVEGLQALAPRLNAIGQRCQEQGITFGYHNHDFEFRRVNGGYLFDYLLQATDPALVKIELDVYWAAYAEVDPLEFMQAHADRIALIHLKDMAADRSMTEVGKGILDMQGIWEFAQARGLWGIVENDHPQMPSLESARISLEYFQS